MSANTAVPCVLRAWQESENELRGFLRRRLQGVDAPDVAEDLHHDLFLRLVRQGAGFCAVKDARAWLFHVVRNLVIDHLRSLRGRSELPEELGEAPVEPAPVEQLASCLPVALSSLAEDDREALTLCDLGGMTQAEYAALHGLSLPGAKSRVQRARARLREALIERCGVRFDETGRVCCHVPPKRD
ncbi:MAG: sigma-70 family RNA polymerase sigma factor [Gammaproteobacteria bacterium]|nr:sigma-70 family RNA polymerase sigma factor [Gammaproteobacteria bacterium]